MNPKKLQRKRREGGFSLIEVAFAIVVLSLVVASSLMAMRMGFSMIEAARDNTLASQILQSEMENLRLKNWEQISELTDGTFDIEEGFSETVANRFVCGRTVTQSKSGLREIALDVEWQNSRGQTINRQYVSFFSKSGLNDYYYRAF